jgi:2-polyprenyl-3-methyl-5-hydroxy-6-metoxy-1,4-benzoquinol methylase
MWKPIMSRRSSKNLADFQAKYRDQSRLAQFANRRFFLAIKAVLQSIEYHKVLDNGCGEGLILEQIQHQRNAWHAGIDLDRQRIQRAFAETSLSTYSVGNVESLPFADNSFDLVLTLEVFEHVGNPLIALQEARRVTSKYLLASVPNEPWWRIGNMLRLKYLDQWGNTPEHINHWSTCGFKNFIQQEFEVLDVRTPFLWTFILAK